MTAPKNKKHTTDAERKAAEGRMDIADLVRVYEASIKLPVPGDVDLQLRDGAANKLVAALRSDDVSPRQITRLFEATCDIKFCEDNDDRFRVILSTALLGIHKLNAKPRISCA